MNFDSVKTIASVAIPASACTKSVVPSCRPRISDSRKPVRSTTAAGTASPRKASHTTAGARKTRVRTGTGRKTSTPTAKACQLQVDLPTRADALT